MSRKQATNQIETPLVIKLVAGWILLTLILNFLGGLGLIIRNSDWLPVLQGSWLAEFTWKGEESITQGVYRLAIGVVGIVALVGFVRMRKWAWLFLLVWATFNLSQFLIGYFLETPNYYGMLLNTTVVWVLNLNQVKKLYHEANLDQGVVEMKHE